MKRLIFFIFMVVATLNAGEKVFTQTYKYRAFSYDFQSVARQKAVDSVTQALHKKIGEFIFPKIDRKKSFKNQVSISQVKKEIEFLASKYVAIDVIEEKWEGRVYYVKATARFDPKSLSQNVIHSIQAKNYASEVDDLQSILSARKSEIKKSRESITKLKGEIAVLKTKNDLILKQIATQEKVHDRLMQDHKKYEQEFQKHTEEVEKVRVLVEEASSKLHVDVQKACLVHKGMNKKSVMKILGKPNSFYPKSTYHVHQCDFKYILTQEGCNVWDYGKAKLVFNQSGSLTQKMNCD